MLIVEAIVLCLLFFALCILDTGTDEKNLKSYSSYTDEVKNKIKEIKEYQGKYREKNKKDVWIENFILFIILFLILGISLKEKNFIHNFISVLILGQALNIFDLIVIDLLWWRNSKRIRFSKIPQKELYQNPKKHIEAFLRAVVLYFVVAVVDGYILTLF